MSVNIHDKAREFADFFKENEDVVAYREAAKKINENETAKKMVEDFRKLQVQMYQEKVSKGDISEETKKKVEQLAGILQMNPEVSNFLIAEQKFSIIFDDVMKIINDAIGIDIPGAY